MRKEEVKIEVDQVLQISRESHEQKEVTDLLSAVREIDR